MEGLLTQDNKRNATCGKSSKGNRAANSEMVTDERRKDGADKGECIWRHGEELRAKSYKTKTLNNSWREKLQGADKAANTHIRQILSIQSVVTEGSFSVEPGNLLITGRRI